MALIETGNDLSVPVIQPGWTVTGDGFGLITSTTKYKCDHTVDLVPFVARGTAHPDASYSFLKAHKYSISWDTLAIATVTIDYVGLDPSINGGAFSNPNTTGANGLTAENITTHPNFFVAQTGYLGAIAGEAPYTQDSPDNLAPNINGRPGYLGLNGSCFEKENGGRFIGFVDPQYKQFYGKTQYLATTTSFTGTIYVAEEASVIDILSYLNTATATTAWGSWDLLPDWATVGMASGVGNKNLLSQVNVESYGTLFKVTYEIRFADRGWDVDVYKNI
jgi:hypothetical protein